MPDRRSGKVVRDVHDRLVVVERLAQTRSEHGRQRGVPNALIREDPDGKVVAVKRLRERRSEGVHVFGPQRTNVHRHDVSMAVYLCMSPRRMRYQHAHGTRTVRHQGSKIQPEGFIKSGASSKIPRRVDVELS